MMWRALKMLASKVVSPEPEPDMSTMPMMTTAMPTARSMKLVRPKANTGCLGVWRGVCCCCSVGWFCFFEGGDEGTGRRRSAWWVWPWAGEWRVGGGGPQALALTFAAPVAQGLTLAAQCKRLVLGHLARAVADLAPLHLTVELCKLCV